MTYKLDDLTAIPFSTPTSPHTTNTDVINQDNCDGNFYLVKRRMGNTENHLTIAMLKYFWAEIAKTPLTSSAVSYLVEFLALLSGGTLLFCYFFCFLGLSFGKFFSVHNLLRCIYCTGRKASLLFYIRWDDGQGVLGFELNATQVSQPAVAGLGSQEVLNNHKHL